MNDEAKLALLIEIDHKREWSRITYTLVSCGPEPENLARDSKAYSGPDQLREDVTKILGPDCDLPDVVVYDPWYAEALIANNIEWLNVETFRLPNNGLSRRRVGIPLDGSWLDLAIATIRNWRTPRSRELAMYVEDPDGAFVAIGGGMRLTRVAEVLAALREAGFTHAVEVDQ